MHTSVSRSLSFKPLSPTVGAEIVGLDPEHIAPQDRTSLRDAWTKYHVLVLRETPLSEELQLDFASSFGSVRKNTLGGFVSGLTSRPEIMVISNIRENGKPQGILADGEVEWHFDGLHQAKPYFGAVLHAIEVPKRGGETRFKNMCAAYRSLPEKTRVVLEGLTATSTYDFGSKGRKALKRDHAAQAAHPVVRVHEDSGEQALYVARLMTERILELSEHDSTELLEELFAYIDASSDEYAHPWKPGDTVVWDNRCVAHARNDFDPSERRFLKRVTIVA